MTTPLKVLLVEDNAADAELILHALRRAGFDPDVRRIDQASELQAALDPSLDLILTDYQLPQFTGLHVVKTVRAAGSDVPVIIVSGAIGEDVAVEALRQGADDYLLKDRLGRLDSAVTNALAQRRLRQEKRVSDEALRESEAHLKNILDNASEAIISVDEAQRITLFNSRAEKMFGYRVEEIIGQPLDLLIPAALVSIHRQHAHDFVHLDNTGHLMRMGRELTCRRKDGSEFPGEIGLSRLIENGQVTITAIVADITERKQAEAAVRASESSLQAVLQSTADGILAVGSDNEVLYSNERFAEMWRIPPTVIADKDDVVLLQHVLDQLVDPQSFLQKVQELYRSVEESFDSLYFKDGRVFERLSQPLIQESKLHGRVWSFRDITSRKQAEAERQTLLEIMQAAATTEDLHSFLGLVHQSVAKVIWAENFFVTLYNQTTGLFEEAYSIDQHDQSPTPPVRFEKSISAYVFRTGRPLLMNQAQFDVLQDAGEVELIGTNSPSWLGVPLKTARGTIGVMVVQDYEQADRYSERDQNFLTSIAAQAALAVERKRAEEALLESEKRFRALIESSSDAITLLGATGKVIYDSPSAPGMLGYGPEDWIGRDVFALIHPEDLPRIQGLFEHLRQTAGARVNFTLRTRHKSGSWLWLEMVATNLLAEPGVNAIVLNYRDVTERKRAETLQNAVYDIAQASALADSLTNLFPQIQRIISGIMPAENFYIALYDQKHNQLSFPYSIDEVDQTYAGEKIEPGRGLTAYVLRTGKSLLCTDSIHKQLVEQGELEQIGVSMQIWLGVPLIVQAKVIGVMVVQHYSDPQAYGEREQRVLEYVSGQVALAIDRKQAEEALAASEAELRALFAAMHDAVLVIDRAGVYREIAPTNLESDLELHRLSPQELLGKKLQDVFPAEQAETFYNVIRRVLATQQIEQIEYELNFNSQAVWYEASISPMSADSTLWVARDITERKRAEEVIQKTESDYRYLFNNANDAIIIFEPEQEIILEANAAACAIYGFAHAELVGLSLKKLTKDLTKGETQVHELLEMGSYHDFESIHLNRKGEQINFLINSSVIEYQGRPAILSLNRDITERKRAEELLRTKVEILQALSEIEHEIIATNDPQGILDLVCRRAAALVHVSKSVITSIGPSGDLELAAHFGLSDPAGFNTIFKRLRQTRRLGGISLAARQMVVLPDPSAMDGPLSELAAGENINAAVIVPLAAYEKATGALVVFNAVPRAWTTDEVSVLNTLAGQAAIALQNARLFQEINRRAERLALLNRISHAVSMTLDIDELLEIVYREVTAKVESEVFLAALYDDQTNELDFRIRVDRGVRQPPERHPLRTGMSGLIIGTKQPVLVRDFEREKAQLPPVSLWGSMEAPRSWLGVPMLLGERVLGVIAVQHYRPNIYNEDDQRLLVTIADSVAVAVENARLYTVQERRAARLAEIVKLGIELGTLQDEYLMLKTLVARTAAIAQSDTCTVLWKEQTNVLTLAAQTGLPENTPLGLPISLPDLPFIHRTLSSGEPLILSDIDQQAPAVRALLVRSDLHSFFAYPMLGLKEIIGVITLSYIVAHKPSQEEINAYQLLAHRAAGAIEDARLFHTEHEQRTWAEALSDTAAALNATLDFDELLDQILANVGRVVPHDAASIMVSESGVARVVRYRGLAERDVVEVTAQLRLQVDEVDDLRRMSETGQAVIIEDTHAASGWTAVPETNWLASSLGAPIRVKGQVIGFISLGSAVPKFFTPMHAARLQSFADQAASALHNAQLLAETQQRAEQFTLLHETVRDLQFQPDVPTLLGIIVDRAKLLLHAPGGFIYLYDAAHSELELVVERDLRVAVGMRLQLGEGMAGHVAQTQQPLLIDDYQSWAGRSPKFSAVAYAAVIEVPMIFSGKLIGVLGVNEFDASERRFAQTDVQLLSLFATQAAGAVQNAQLFESEREQVQRLEILYRATQAINSTLNISPILDRLTDEAMRATHATHGSVLIANRVAGYFERRSLRGYSLALTEKAQAERLPLDAGVNGRAFQTAEVVYVPDVRTDPDYFPLVLQTRAEMAMPILQNGQVIGNLDLQSPTPDAFQAADLGFLKALTDQVAVALEKARLFEEIQEYAAELEDRVTHRTEELTTANERLTELDRLKDQFVSMVSHEYRTPLTTILSSAELLEHYNTRLSDDRKHEHLRRITSAVKHMTALLEDISIIGQADANKLEFVPVPIDLEKYCRDLVEEFQLTAGSQYHLALSSRGQCADANMDVNLLRHILSNVLSNAVKYSPRGGDIEFELTCEEAWVVFRIRDHGIGIPQPDQSRIFESFQRGSNTGNIAGTGLGLAIVYRSVALHHGTINIESEVGVGTTVTLKLPLSNSSTLQESS